MEKTIEIDGKKVKFKATAATPRLYRLKYGRDLLKDLSTLSVQARKNKFDIPSLEVFENAAHIMAKQADPAVPDDAGEWLDGFETFAIRDILPAIMELWNANTETMIASKKKLTAIAGK